MNHAQELYRAGVSFCAHGTIKRGRQITAYFYRLSTAATSEQIATIRRLFPHVSTGYGFSEFAPENRHSVLIFPSMAELKRRGLK